MGDQPVVENPPERPQGKEPRRREQLINEEDGGEISPLGGTDAATMPTSKPHIHFADFPSSSYGPPPQTEGFSSWSQSSEKQIGSPRSSKDRVFPIKSAVSMDISQTSTPHASNSRSPTQDYFPSLDSIAGARMDTNRPSSQNSGTSSLRSSLRGPSQQDQLANIPLRLRKESLPSGTHDSSRYGGGSRMRLFNDASSDNSNSRTESSYVDRSARSVGYQTPSEVGSINGHITARFKHIVTAEGHAVITGHDGDAIQRCEDEPIHIPGAIQSFGLLVALEEKEDGQLLVRVVSENSYRMIGYTPQQLFQLESFCDILSEEQQENLLDHIDFIRDEDADSAETGPEVFTMVIKSPKASHTGKRSQKLWCALHINPTNPDAIILEFELDDDALYPLVPQNEDTPERPEDTLQSVPTPEEYNESTHPMSKPLRVLRSARKRKGEAAAMEVFNIMSQVQEQLAAASSLEIFLKILVGVVKELTGFHRVMIYQFDSSFNGRVVTELVDPRATKDLYKGLNFPASDIPKQARDLYKINKVRLLYDRDLETARLVCRTIEDLETPLDLSFSYLRAMSPIHIKYLKNMAVRSSMSISINAFGDLWGLVSCHGYGAKGLRVSFPIRKMCRLIGDTASRNIEKLSYASRLQARKLINTVPTEANPSGYIIASSDDLLKLFDADFGLLSIRGETKIMGKVDHTQEALAMLEYLRMRKITSVVTSQDVRESFPDLVYQPGFVVISGLLLVPLSVSGSDFIVFFRRGGVREVKWAGNPYEKFVKEGTSGYLEPRTSFKTWSETVVGKCREWTEEQVETAAVLCLVYGKFIEVWRQKEAMLQKNQLTKLLLANSAHEVRTPLNAIINYLEIALEGALDQETRDNLTKSHSASKSLIYVINDLLDLTKTEEGQELIKDEVFDLSETIREATAPFAADAQRKGIEYEIIEHPGLPKFVQGDQRRVRQAISNIIVNAVQNTSTGFVRVELWLQDIAFGRATVEIVVQDSGVGMSNEKLDAIFTCLEQVTTDDDDEVLESSDEMKARLTDGKEGTSGTVGLGLAVVARIVRNMNGQLRLKSEEGVGSRFVVQFSFLLPSDTYQAMGFNDMSSPVKADQTSTHSAHSANLQTPATPEGEVTLVDKGSSLRAEGVSRKRSVEAFTSLRSFRSNSSGKSNRSSKSNKSDVDRMIDAISGTLHTPEDDLDDKSSYWSGHSRNKHGSSSSARASGLAQPHERPDELGRTSNEGVLERKQAGIIIEGAKTSMKAIKMPDEFSQHTREQVASPSKGLVGLPKNQNSNAEKAQLDNGPGALDAEQLQVLIAEDDPINSRILKKRLEKGGHRVFHTINGEECARAYEKKPAFFDVVLMDMQMPIVDGMTSTKMIRSSENSHTTAQLSNRALVNGRVPIFAVSASLVERNRQEYIVAGFDGWILKPVDFKRLNELLRGIVEDDTQSSCLYKPGEWERGGWFHARQSSRTDMTARPSSRSPVQNAPSDGSSDLGNSTKSGSSEGSGSITPNNHEYVLGDRLKRRMNLKVVSAATSDDTSNTAEAVKGPVVDPEPNF